MPTRLPSSSPKWPRSDAAGGPLPPGFAVPTPDAWKAGHTRQAQGLPHLDGIGFEEAVALVKAFLDPVLGGRRDGWWRPEGRAWEP